jgi:hypothetical protein
MQLLAWSLCCNVSGIDPYPISYLQFRTLLSAFISLFGLDGLCSEHLGSHLFEDFVHFLEEAVSVYFPDIISILDQVLTEGYSWVGPVIAKERCASSCFGSLVVECKLCHQ